MPKNVKGGAENAATLTFPGTLKINAPGVLFFLTDFRFFPVCNLLGCSDPARHGFPPQKIYFRKFPQISGFFRFENVQFSMLKCFRWMDTAPVV